MDILEETAKQDYALNVYVNIHVNTKYKKIPMKFGNIFIGVFETDEIATKYHSIPEAGTGTPFSALPAWVGLSHIRKDYFP